MSGETLLSRGNHSPQSSSSSGARSNFTGSRPTTSRSARNRRRSRSHPFPHLPISIPLRILGSRPRHPPWTPKKVEASGTIAGTLRQQGRLTSPPSPSQDGNQDSAGDQASLKWRSIRKHRRNCQAHSKAPVRMRLASLGRGNAFRNRATFDACKHISYAIGRRCAMRPAGSPQALERRRQGRAAGAADIDSRGGVVAPHRLDCWRRRAVRRRLMRWGPEAESR